MPVGVTQAVRGQRAGLTLGVAVLALLVIAAIASGAAATGGSSHVGLSSSATRPAGEVVVAAFSGLLVVSAALAGVVTFFLVSSRRRKKDPDEPERVSETPPLSWLEKVAAVALPILLIVGLATAIVIAARRAKHPTSSSALHAGATTGLPGSVHHPLSQASGGGTSAAAVGLVAGICIVAAAAAFVVFLRLRQRRRARLSPGSSGSPYLAALANTVALSIDDLRRERDPRRAIVAAYARMELAFASLGLPRAVGQTSAEYMGRVLSQAAAPPAPVVELTELFQEAKFSQHRLTSRDRDDALQALVAIREAIL